MPPHVGQWIGSLSDIRLSPLGNNGELFMLLSFGREERIVDLESLLFQFPNNPCLITQRASVHNPTIRVCLHPDSDLPFAFALLTIQATCERLSVTYKCQAYRLAIRLPAIALVMNEKFGAPQHLGSERHLLTWN